MPRSPLALGLAKGRSKPLNAARLLNLFPMKAPPGSMAEWVLYGTPGQKAFATIGSGAIRGGKEALGYLYTLSGSTLYRVDEALNATACTGDVIPAAGRVHMIDNGVQLGMLANNQMFSVTGTVITAVTDNDFPAVGASSVDYIDGYGAFTTNGTEGEWFLSGLYDFLTYDAGDFATAESSPDGLRKLLAVHKEAWLFGDETTEVWVNTGTSPFPFELVPGSLMDRGIAAPASAIKMDNSVFWLGDDRIIYRADGYTPVRVSTDAVDEILKSGVVSDAEAYTHVIAGHHFYVLKLPSLGRTLCLDAATNIWHERQTGTSLEPDVWDVNCIFQAFGKTLVGLADGVIAELDLDTYMDGTTQIRRSVTSFPVYSCNRGIMREIELECELGVGLATGQGEDPQAMLRFSRDGGQTFGNEKWKSIGPVGVRRKRAKWNQLGWYRDGVAELSIADPVKVAVYGARYEAEEMVG